MTPSAKAKVKQAQARIVSEIEALATSEDWAGWLAFAARFHKYSAGNVFLIGAQRPDASHVAGFKKWQELGRQVRKSEQGITILAPRSGQCGRCEGAGCDGCGKSGRYLYFTTATVFDVSQTDGEDLPVNPVRSSLLVGDDEKGLFDLLVSRLVPEGWAVEVGNAGSANGWCSHEKRTVMVGEGLSPLQKVKTLTHELAHVVLHPDNVKYFANRGRCEVEAESVAYVVLSALGVDTAEYSFGYVASWSDGDASVVRATAGSVCRVASDFLGRLELVPELA